MKKLLALLLVLAMATSLVACGKTEPVEDESPAVNEEVQMEEEAPTEEQQKEPAEESVEKPAEEKKEETKKPEENKKPAEDKKPAETPAEKPAEKPVEKPEEKPAEEPKTVGTKLLAEFKKMSGTPLSIAESFANGGSLPFMAGAMEVEPGLLAGFDNYEVKGFKSGAVFQPMIGSIAFIGYVFELEDGVSASDFVANLKKNANKRWNICVEAEEMVTGTAGNKVFFVMCPKAFEE